LAAEEGAGDAAGEGHAADRVAERARRHAERSAVVGWGDRGGDAAAGPEGDGVVAALLGVVAPGPVPGADGVDDVRVAGLHVRDVEAELGPGGGQVAGEEDVGLGGEVEHDLAGAGLLQVEGDAALAPVPDLPGE